MRKVKGKLHGDVFYAPGLSQYWLDLECGHHLRFLSGREPGLEVDETFFVPRCFAGSARDPRGTGCPCERLLGREHPFRSLPTSDDEVWEIELEVPA